MRSNGSCRDEWFLLERENQEALLIHEGGQASLRCVSTKAVRHGGNVLFFATSPPKHTHRTLCVCVMLKEVEVSLLSAVSR